MYIFFYILLNVVHFLSDVYYFIQQQYVRLMLMLKHYRFVKANSKYSIIDPKYLLKDVPKIPKHLAIILGLEDISTCDILNLIDWCVALRIPYVTLYDHKGNLKKNKSICKKQFHNATHSAEHIIGLSDNSNDIKDHDNLPQINKITNDFTCKNIDTFDLNDECDTKVQVLSYLDGKGKIVDLTKSLAKSVISKTFQVDNITPELLDEKLQSNAKIPDPDLAIVFGKTMCSFGFLPWQTRITEFLPVSTHHDISLDEFKEVLIRFGACQQHYGK